jgi:hypothetical protein
MPVCEGCGTRSDELHIQRRAERLRLAKVYRPTSIRVLLLDAAPPARMDDFFYSPATDRSPRSPASRNFFDAMIKLLGNAPGVEKSDEAALTEFSRRGFFLCYAVECPFEDIVDPQGTLRRLAPTIIKRVQAELEPSYIVPLSKPTQELIRLFGMVGWGDRLVLDNGGPFLDPTIGDRLRKSIAQLV